MFMIPQLCFSFENSYTSNEDFLVNHLQFSKNVLKATKNAGIWPLSNIKLFSEKLLKRLELGYNLL